MKRLSVMLSEAKHLGLSLADHEHRGKQSEILRSVQNDRENHVRFNASTV
jgi:hypothetical protein